MAAEEGRIQRIVREIVSPEIGEPNLPTNVQIYQSNREAPVNTGGGFQNVNEELRCRFPIPRRFPANGDRECALSPLLAPDAERQAPQQQIASIFNPSFNYGGRMNRRRPPVARELFLTHMEARDVHHVSSPVPAVFRQLSTTKMLFFFPKPALTKKNIYKPSPHFI